MIPLYKCFYKKFIGTQNGRFSLGIMSLSKLLAYLNEVLNLRLPSVDPHDQPVT